MKIIIADHVQQTRNWVNDNLPKTYNYSSMRGVEDDGQDSEFIFIFRNGGWMDRLQGITITSYLSLSRAPLTPTEESFMESRIR